MSTPTYAAPTAAARAGFAVIEQAKGALMLRYGVDPDGALRCLRRWAADRGTSVLEIADALVTGICQGRCDPADRQLMRWLEARLREALPVAPV